MTLMAVRRATVVPAISPASTARVLKMAAQVMAAQPRAVRMSVQAVREVRVKAREYHAN